MEFILRVKGVDNGEQPAGKEAPHEMIEEWKLQFASTHSGHVLVRSSLLVRTPWTLFLHLDVHQPLRCVVSLDPAHGIDTLCA